MQRREFLTSILGLLGSGAAVSLAYPIVRLLAPPQGAGEQKPVVLSKNEIPVGESKGIVYNNIPAIVINHPQKGLLAFSRVCTHLGCLVDYNKNTDKLICPCHAGTFSLDGNVVSGPPPKPLPKLPLMVHGEEIIIG